MKSTIKFLVIFMIVDLQGLTLLGQYHLVPQWKKSRTSTLSGGNSEGWGVDTDPEGNVYWSASFDSTSTNRLYDIMTYKFSADGSEKWSSWYGGTGLQHEFVINARDSFLYIGGRENTVWPYWSTESNMLLLKIDKVSGALLKNRNWGFGSGGYDEMDAIEMDGSAIYCSGWAQVTPGVGNYEMGFLKLDYGLGILEQKTFGDLASGSAEHQDGHIVVDDSVIFAAGLWNGHTGINWIADGRCLLGKFDLNWNYRDTVLFGPALAAPLDPENALGTATDGTSIYITGYAAPVSSSDMQIFIAKFDKNLNQKWITYFGDSGTESARGITCKNGFIFVCGTTSSSQFATSGGYDAVLLRLDTATGTQLSWYTWGDSKDNDFRDLVAHDNYLYLSGTTGTNLFGGGSSDEAFLLKTDLSNLTGMVPVKDGNFRFGIYPNPARDVIHLYANDILWKVQFEDMTGRRFDSFLVNNREVTIPVTCLSAGTYVVRVSDRYNNSIVEKFVVIP